MDINLRSRYLKALQSKVVNVIGPGHKIYPVPCELIYMRSAFVRQKLSWPGTDVDVLEVDLSETPVQILDAFVVWVYAATPEIHPSTTFDDVVELAIFADLYAFEALHNQALDLLRQRLGEQKWFLKPHSVKRVYDSCYPGTPLRRFFRVLLKSARQNPRNSGSVQETIDAWASVFDTTSDIGTDFYISICDDFPHTEVLNGGPCRFHWHKDVDRDDINHSGDRSCPHASSASFADWTKFSLPEKLQVVEAVPRKKKSKKKAKVNVSLPGAEEAIVKGMVGLNTETEGVELSTSLSAVPSDHGLIEEPEY